MLIEENELLRMRELKISREKNIKKLKEHNNLTKIQNRIDRAIMNNEAPNYLQVLMNLLVNLIFCQCVPALAAAMVPTEAAREQRQRERHPTRARAHSITICVREA